MKENHFSVSYQMPLSKDPPFSLKQQGFFCLRIANLEYSVILINYTFLYYFLSMSRVAFKR